MTIILQMKPSFLLLFIFFSSFIYSQKVYTYFDVPKNLTKNANSVILEEKRIVDVSNPGVLNTSYYIATMVLNKRGSNRLSTLAYYDEGSKIKKIKAIVYDAYGNELKTFKKKDFLDVSASDGISMYSDDRVMYINYTPTTFPYTLIFSYEKTSNSTGIIPEWYPISDYASATKSSTYILLFDPNNKPRYQPKNLDKFHITITESPNQIICSAKNLIPIKYEELAPDFSNIAPSVKFTLNHFTLKGVKATATNWKEFGDWMYHSLLRNTNDLPQSTIDEVKRLIKNDTSNILKARKIYQYVQDKVRYISIQIGIGGWKPMKASEVDKLSYGDCKALTNYTKSLLDAVGVPSYYTIIYAGDTEKNIDKTFSRIEGNHVILGIPNNQSITWLECTSQDTPFGFIGDFTDDRDALMITPDGGKIVHTKKYSLQENKQKINATVVISTNGDISSNVKIESYGLKYDDRYLLEKLKKTELYKHYKNQWSYIPSISIEQVNLFNDKKNIIFKENIQISASHYMTKIGKDFLLCPNLFSQYDDIPRRYENRLQNFHLPDEYIQTSQFEIILPENCRIDEIPKKTELKNEFGKYTMFIEKIAANKLIYHRELLLKKGDYSPSQYKDYRNFIKKINKLDKTKIILLNL